VTAVAALARLRDLGVTAEARGDKLTLRPASAIPPDLLADLRARKAEVLALLNAIDTGTADSPDAWGLTPADRAEAMARLRAPMLPPASPEQAAAEAADRAAIAVEPPLPRPAVAPEPPPDMVEALASAMAANSTHRITDHDKAVQFFRAQARRRLCLTDDPMVCGLLLGFERHQWHDESGPPVAARASVVAPPINPGVVRRHQRF